ncbi:MAG: hypothetical protein HXY20_12755 [Acidobacteria bacterium]|nr:hypothetical protein [Acidobacteriota bacterium]
MARRSLEPRIESLGNDFREIQLQVSQALARAAERLQGLRELDFEASADALSPAVEELAQHRLQELRALMDDAAAIQCLETQEEILNSLLDGASRGAHRVALFTVRGKRIHGWSSRGYDDEAATGITSYESSAENPLFRLALSSEAGITTDDLSEAPGLVELLLGGAPGRLHLFPMKTMGRPVGILAVVPSGRPAECLEALRLLVSVSAMRIENLALRILKEIEIAATARGEPAAPAVAKPVLLVQEPPAAEASVPQAEMPAAREPRASAAGQTEGIGAEVATPPQELVPETGTAGPFPLTAEPTAPSLAEEPAGVEAVEQAVPSEMPLPPSPIQETGAQPQYAPPFVRRDAAEEPQRLTEEERLHTEAKRFARLLISEIKLYNEERVVEGRANRDIYVRLKKDIDRSREMYRKRVSPQVSRKVDYFHDEIVRILGENDPSLLGSDYPGPLIEN